MGDGYDLATDVYDLRITGEAMQALLDRLNDGTVRPDGYIEQWRVERVGSRAHLDATLHRPPYVPEKVVSHEGPPGKRLP